MQRIGSQSWKRAEDLIVGGILFVLFSPLCVLIAAAIALESGRPIFFLDERIGIGGHPFRMIKFRTMIPDAIGEGLGRLVASGDPRITRVGRILRRWSLDETPQLFNVLSGAMSVVGPRPTYKEQVARYTARDRGRLATKPGITGLAQVSGRNDLSWRRRIDLDLIYVERMSVWLDLSILARTPFVVLRGVGLYGKGGVTPDYERD